MGNFIIAAILATTIGLYPAALNVSKADIEAATATPQPAVVQPVPVALETHRVWVTAYSSSPDETDDTPFITALGTQVRDGIVATNLLPFGTKLKIPALFGEKVFVVEDRMHRRKKNIIDIWMPSKAEALRFGASYTDVVIVTSETLPLALKK